MGVAWSGRPATAATTTLHNIPLFYGTKKYHKVPWNKIYCLIYQVYIGNYVKTKNIPENTLYAMILA
jgi:hypothetical protein